MCHNQSLKNFWFPNLLLCITLLVFNNSAKNTQIQIQKTKCCKTIQILSLIQLLKETCCIKPATTLSFFQKSPPLLPENLIQKDQNVTRKNVFAKHYVLFICNISCQAAWYWNTLKGCQLWCIMGDNELLTFDLKYIYYGYIKIKVIWG